MTKVAHISFEDAVQQLSGLLDQVEDDSGTRRLEQASGQLGRDIDLLYTELAIQLGYDGDEGLEDGLQSFPLMPGTTREEIERWVGFKAV